MSGISQKEHYIKINKDVCVHHIDYDKTNNIENNMICLCISCNIKANYNREFWKKYYNEKIETIYKGVN